MNQNKTLTEFFLNILFVSLHVMWQRHRSVNMQMWYFIIKIIILKSQGYFQ